MAITLAAYAAVWLEHCDVKEHTRLRYPALLEQHINPTLGTVPLAHLTGAAVPAWHASLDPKHPAIKALGVHREFEPLPVHQPGAPVVEHCVGYPRLHGVWVRARCTPTSATQSKGSESDEYQTRATPLVTCCSSCRAFRRRARPAAYPFRRSGTCPRSSSDSGCGSRHYDDEYRSGLSSPGNAPLLLLASLGPACVPQAPTWHRKPFGDMGFHLRADTEQKTVARVQAVYT